MIGSSPLRIFISLGLVLTVMTKTLAEARLCRQPAFAFPQTSSSIAAAAGILLLSSSPSSAPSLSLAVNVNVDNNNNNNNNHGAALFQANCAGCHAGGMNFISEKKNLKKEALEKFQSLDQVKLQSFVQQGMPHRLLPFAKTFSDADYFDTTSYVLDQALNDKW
jgi:cytochrome c6